MKSILNSASFMALTLAAAGVVSAQTFAVPSSSGTYGGYGYGYGDCGYGYHSSTFEEGVLRGYATLAQGLGQGNYYNSLAAINYQEARSRSIVNRQKAIEVYFYNKQANQAAREAQRSPRLTTEQYATLAKKEAPARLSDQQYDRAFGLLAWPVALGGDQYAAERAALNEVFESRTPGDAGASSDFYRTVRPLAGSLLAKLETQVHTLDAAEYTTAKRFLQSLSQEAKQPLNVRTLAAR